MTYECPECSNQFTSRTALCVDWSDSNKSLGCPSCGTFYLQDPKPKLKEQIRIGMFAGGIMTPAAMIIGQHFSKGESSSLVYGLGILFSCFVILFLDSPGINRDLIKSPYNKQRNTDSGDKSPSQVR
jgi:DNA-directed RNA polymerase subunit RPC12/RpoP